MLSQSLVFLRASAPLRLIKRLLNFKYCQKPESASHLAEFLAKQQKQHYRLFASWAKYPQALLYSFAQSSHDSVLYRLKISQFKFVGQNGITIFWCNG